MKRFVVGDDRGQSHAVASSASAGSDMATANISAPIAVDVDCRKLMALSTSQTVNGDGFGRFNDSTNVFTVD